MYVYTAICGAWLVRRLIHRKDFQVTQSIPGASAPRRRAPRTLGAGLLALLLAACGGGGEQKPAAAGGGAPPPPEVAVVTVQPQTTPLVTELPGRVEASRVAQVRARVNGIVLKRLFREGSEVKAGQLLFQIDPAPYQAAVDSAKAVLAKAQANLRAGQRTGDALQAAGRRQGHQRAGVRQRAGGAGAGARPTWPRPRRRCAPRS